MTCDASTDDDVVVAVAAGPVGAQRAVSCGVRHFDCEFLVAEFECEVGVMRCEFKRVANLNGSP